jgi:hypothetical protein
MRSCHIGCVGAHYPSVGCTEAESEVATEINNLRLAAAWPPDAQSVAQALSLVAAPEWHLKGYRPAHALLRPASFPPLVAKEFSSAVLSTEILLKRGRCHRSTLGLLLTAGSWLVCSDTSVHSVPHSLVQRRTLIPS